MTSCRVFSAVLLLPPRQPRPVNLHAATSSGRAKRRASISPPSCTIKATSKDSAKMNVWLHKQVMIKLAQNGGKVPDELKH